VKQINPQLFELLDATGGMIIPLLPDCGGVQNKRRPEGSNLGDFPPEFSKKPCEE
jgi:hypothetical protein